MRGEKDVSHTKVRKDGVYSSGVGIDRHDIGVGQLKHFSLKVIFAVIINTSMYERNVHCCHYDSAILLSRTFVNHIYQTSYNHHYYHILQTYPGAAS